MFEGESIFRKNQINQICFLKLCHGDLQVILLKVGHIKNFVMLLTKLILVIIKRVLFIPKI